VLIFNNKEITAVSPPNKYFCVQTSNVWLTVTCCWQVRQYASRRDEAYHTVDAYRKAFEEQLQKNRALNTRLVNLTTGRTPDGAPTRRSRATLALKWLIGSLTDDGRILKALQHVCLWHILLYM